MARRRTGVGSVLALVALCACSESFSGTNGDDAGSGGGAGSGGSGSGSATLVLNEVDYDNPDLDTAEFVEIVNASGTEQSLEGIALVLVNGAVGANAEYARVKLSGSLAPGKFAIVAAAGVAADGNALRFQWPGTDNQLQNAGEAGDAIGLLSLDTNRLLDALSYGGSVLGASVTGAGNLDFVEGNPTQLVDDGPSSLVRMPDGTDTNDAAHDWQRTITPTPGAPNQL